MTPRRKSRISCSRDPTPDQYETLLSAVCSLGYGVRGSLIRQKVAFGRPRQGIHVPNVDVTAPYLHGSGLPKPGERAGHGLAVRPDHGPELLVSVAGRYPVARTAP